jgi:hypothetical protein
MVCFQTKNPDLGKFWRALDLKMFIYFMATWNILRRVGIFYDHLVHFVFIWCIFSGFGIMYQEKSGNPGWELKNAIRIFFYGDRWYRSPQRIAICIFSGSGRDLYFRLGFFGLGKFPKLIVLKSGSGSDFTK